MSNPIARNEERNNSAQRARFALLIVDMQVGLFDADDNPFERERILDNINLLIRSARAAGVPTLAARHTGPVGSPLAPDSPMTRLVDRLEIEPERDWVFTKTRPNCFVDTLLTDELARFFGSPGYETEVYVWPKWAPAPSLIATPVLFATCSVKLEWKGDHELRIICPDPEGAARVEKHPWEINIILGTPP